jgi:DNA-binding PadR family transcriptional regulator
MADRTSTGSSSEQPKHGEGAHEIGVRVERAIVGALRGQDLTGHEIWRWLGAGHGVEGLLTEADLYPTLYRLEVERILESDWQEAERIRRKYRLTANALAQADEHGWPALAPRDETGAIAGAARSHSPDPDAGSWFVPPRPESPAEAQAVGGLTGSSAPGASAPDATAPETGSGAPPWDRRSGNPAIAGYEETLGAGLDLPPPEAARVRQEIADHLTDSAAALRQEGLGAAAATARAIERLGDPVELAARVVGAQQTRQRRARAYRRAVIELTFELILWISLTAGVLAVTSGLADVVMALMGKVGLHVTVIRSAEWATNQLAIMYCVGAFAAGRLSLGWLARISRHTDATLRPRWALAGAVVVLVAGLLLPGFPDGFAVLTFLAAPFGFVAGTFRPLHANESSYTWRALGQALVVVAAVTFLPLVRLFALDLGGTPGIPAAPGAPTEQITIYQQADGAYQYSVELSKPAAIDIEIWPAKTSGAFVVVDPSARGPVARVLSSGNAVHLADLSPAEAWWVVAVETMPNGDRQAVAVVVQAPEPGRLNTALGWILAHL